MSQTTEQKLQSVYSSVSDAYKGTGADIYALCKEMRHTQPVWEGDFIGKFGVPTNAGSRFFQGDVPAADRRAAPTAENPDTATAGRDGALPDFVVVGAMKGGTTFFYRMLSQHPSVRPAGRKEVQFFDLGFHRVQPLDVAPGHTLCMEFDDGKLMLSSVSHLSGLTPERLEPHRAAMVAALRQAHRGLDAGQTMLGQRVVPSFGDEGDLVA